MSNEHAMYKSLKELYEDSRAGWDSGDWGNPGAEWEAALTRAKKEIDYYEMMLGPLPDWAVAHNLTDDLVPGLQLLTKDGRHCGNAHVISIEEQQYDDMPAITVYTLLTDAGNEMHFSLTELEHQFYRGKFISKPEDVIARFGRCDFYKED